MSDIVILLDSTRATGQDSDNFEIYFNQPVRFHGHPHEVCLKSISLWNSYYNIDPQYNNTDFTYSPDGGSTWVPETIEPGNYSLEQLQDHIHQIMKDNNHYTVDGVTGEDVFDINFIPNFSTSKLFIELSNNYQIDFTGGNLYLLLGFSSIILTASAYGSNFVNINNDVLSLVVSCPGLVSGGSFDNGRSSSAIYEFTPNVPPGSIITVTPFDPVYVSCSTLDYIDRIRLQITDQSGRRIDLHNQSVNAVLRIRPREIVKK